MTQKRFMLDDAGELIDLNNHKFINYGEECCNLLNEQHEANQELKAFIKRLTNNCGKIVLMNGNAYNVKKALGDLDD